MYSMVITDNIIDNNHIMFLKVANKIDLKCSLSTHSEKDNYVRRWISISNYHVVHLKFTYFYMSHIFQLKKINAEAEQNIFIFLVDKEVPRIG